MFIINEIILDIGHSESELPSKILKKLKLNPTKWNVDFIEIAEKSIDARDKKRIKHVYKIKFTIAGKSGKDFDEQSFLESAKKKGVKVAICEENHYEIPTLGDAHCESPALGDACDEILACEGANKNQNHENPTSNATNKKQNHEKKPRPVVVGFGPCGIFASYILAKAGLRPIVLERGRKVEDRISDVESFWRNGNLDENSNVLFGEGGAGTFSDGKLTTGIGDHRKRYVLELIAGAGGGKDLLTLKKPHIGTDVLRDVVKSLREEIISLGGEILFGHKLTGIHLKENGELKSIVVEKVQLKSVDSDRGELKSVAIEKVQLKSVAGDRRELKSVAIEKMPLKSVDSDRRELESVAVEKMPLKSVDSENGELKSIAVEKVQLESVGGDRRELKSVAVEKSDIGETFELEAEELIISIGHSARDTFRVLFDAGIEMQQKPFSMGVRVEHPQNHINANQYGFDFEKIYGMNIADADLPPAEYKLSYRCDDGRGVYSFCMCPGGIVVVAASEAGGVFSNGMSNRKRDGEFANSAILTDVRTSDFGSEHPLAGLDYQRRYEKAAFELNAGETPNNQNSDSNPYKLISETFGDFKKKNSKMTSCLPDFVRENIIEAMPHFARKIKGFNDDEVKIYGPETRSSSPVRIMRNEQMQSNIKGIYPCGEGAGHAGGIMSAAVDGIKAAEIIISSRADFPQSFL